MKNKEKKLVAEKLEGLNTLPEGYRPDLDSKWALLEEAMEERVASGWRIHLKWLTVAACLLLISTTALWLNLGQGETKDRTAKNNLSKNKYRLPVVLNKEEQEQDQKASPAAIVLEAAAKKKKQGTNSKQVPGEAAPAFPHQKTAPAELSPMEAAAENDRVILNNDPVEPAPASMAEVAAAPVNEKKKKQRYVEMDFGAPNLNLQPTPEQRVFTQLFHLKIFPDPVTPGIISNSENHFLKIKKSFK